MADRRKKMSATLSTDLSHAIDRLGEEAGHNFPSQDSSVVFANCILGVYENVAFHFLTDDHKPGRQEAMAKDAVEFTMNGAYGK